MPFRQFLTWRHLFTAFLLVLPALGLWEIVAGTIEGPNYFAYRVVVVDTVTSREIPVHQHSRGMRNAKEVVWSITYHYMDEEGREINGKKPLYRGEVPANIKEMKPGDQLYLRIAVDEEEGSLGLSHRADQGFGIFLTFGLMAFPLILFVHAKDDPKKKQFANHVTIAVFVLAIAAMFLL